MLNAHSKLPITAHHVAQPAQMGTHNGFNCKGTLQHFLKVGLEDGERYSSSMQQSGQYCDGME
jgi:hypothetical protein